MKHQPIMIPIAILLSTPATAAIECIDLTPPSDLAQGQMMLRAGSDWIIQIPVGSKSQRRIQGIAACSGTNGRTTTAGTTARKLTMYPAEKNIYCWCKMTWPALSNWVTVGYNSSWSTAYKTTDECLQKCAEKCADFSRSSTMINKYKATIEEANNIEYF